MKRFLATISLVLGLGLFFSPTLAYADWTYGNVTFSGNQPSNCLNYGSVKIYYNGQLEKKSVRGNTEYWECTGDVCVIYPKNYSGPELVFTAKGSVQIRRL